MYMISQAAAATGLPNKTIRYYEEIGLVKATARSEAGYRFYDSAALQKLNFAKRAREFGFSIDDTRELLRLYQAEDRTSEEVKALAEMRLHEIEHKKRQLQILQDELGQLIAACPGDNNMACPILEAMA